MKKATTSQLEHLKYRYLSGEPLKAAWKRRYFLVRTSDKRGLANAGTRQALESLQAYFSSTGTPCVIRCANQGDGRKVWDKDGVPHQRQRKKVAA